ncbi:ABC-type transport auxiliary lipoprotein family protein [Aestuariibius sp. 2305UL40-4]|uniref:ABC-type transport auxiliary lipoprotein family protein n=1 Tax=Aestuariibius violaceus TaxID=3234132 RepID=UPI00345EAD2E
MTVLARSLFLSLVLAGLASCTAIAALDRAAEPQNVYELRPPDDIPVARATRSTQLIIEVPTASGAVGTDRILIRPTPSQIAYLPDARWSEPAPVMLQTALVEALLATNAFRFVGRRPLGPSGDVALVSDLTGFETRIAPETGTNSVQIRLTVRLVRERDARILATQTFASSVPIPDTSTPAIIAGFEQTSADVLEQTIRWIITAL